MIDLDMEWDGLTYGIRVLHWDLTEARGDWEAWADDGSYMLDPNEVDTDFKQAAEEMIHDALTPSL